MKKYIGYLIALSLLVLPAFAFAMNTTDTSSYTEDQLVTLIAKLQKQLEEIRSNKVQCNIADVDLSIGDGEDSTQKEVVKNVQNFLKEKGYFSAAQTATGYFGKITRASVIAFQKAAGLEQSGELNAATRTYIKTLKCQKNYFTNNTEVKNRDSVVSSIKLTNSGKSLTWSAVGYSKNGFKIVWSKNSAPAYPTREGDQYIYLSDPSATNTSIEPFNGSGTYYARVCEYLGGACGVYSNQIQVSL